jgi:transposase
MIEASPSAYPSGMLAGGKTKVNKKEETSRRFYTTQHPLYCGIDLHARSMYVWVLSQEGAILLHRNMKAAPEPFLKAVAPYRDGLVVAVECLFIWYGLADLCVHEGIPFVLGHALSMQAIHGGKAKNDKIDSQKIAALLRGGMLPPASVSPAELRATRALLRRRTPLRRKRAALLAPVQHTNSQYNLPEIGKKIAYTAHRQGVAERFAEAAVQKTMAVDLALIPYYDALRKDLALSILKTAKHHEAHTLSLLPTVPGIGKMLRLVLLYDIHDIRRFPRVQDFASDPRLVKCSKASGGKRLGTSGKTIGHAHLTWAFAEAATLFLRNNEPGQKLLARLEKKHDTGKALSILAHKLGRAISYMRKRKVAFDMERFLQTSGRSAGEPSASLDP